MASECAAIGGTISVRAICWSLFECGLPVLYALAFSTPPSERDQRSNANSCAVHQSSLMQSAFKRSGQRQTNQRGPLMPKCTTAFVCVPVAAAHLAPSTRTTARVQRLTHSQVGLSTQQQQSWQLTTADWDVQACEPAPLATRPRRGPYATAAPSCAPPPPLRAPPTCRPARICGHSGTRTAQAATVDGLGHMSRCNSIAQHAHALRPPPPAPSTHTQTRTDTHTTMRM